MDYFEKLNYIEMQYDKMIDFAEKMTIESVKKFIEIDLYDYELKAVCNGILSNKNYTINEKIYEIMERIKNW